MYTKQESLANKLAIYYRLAEKQSSLSLQAYLNHCVIKAFPNPKRFGLIKEPWQDAIFGALTPRIEYLAGIRKEEPPGPRYFWFTLPKGHDKSSGEARLINYLLAFGKRPGGLRMYVAAKDEEQANEIALRMELEQGFNPWFAKYIEQKKTQAVGRGGLSKILTYDPSGTQGKTPDFIICDELTCWGKPDFYNTLISGMTKNPMAVFVVITNAGVKGTWQWDCLQDAKRQTNFWHVYEAPEYTTLASWMTRESLEALRNQLPPSEFDRLYNNVWVDNTEDSVYVTRQEALLAEDVGRVYAASYRDIGEGKHQYFASIDYGPTKDRTVLCVLHLDIRTNVFIVDKMDVWQGSKGENVQISAVEEWMQQTYYNFPGVQFIIDPYQMEGTIQKLHKQLPIEKFEFRGGKNNYKMAEVMRGLLLNRRLGWYAGCGGVYVNGKLHTLTDELAELVVQRMSYGYRFNHDSKKHDDRVVALGMAIMLANKNHLNAFTPPQGDAGVITLEKQNGIQLPPISGLGGGIKAFGVK